jgi:hypothetical protein
MMISHHVGRPLILTLLFTLVASARTASAQGHQHGDSAFHEVQKRGQQTMGVNQYTSTHRFDLLPGGARIRLQRNDADSAGTAVIRAHLREIATAFSNGDFSSPMLVHDREVPGTATMAAKRAVISYRMRPLPRGGEVLISTRDAGAQRAIREFVMFQRTDHRAGGKDSTAAMHQQHRP